MCVPFTCGSECNLQGLKDLVPTSWCQMLQDTFRGLEESMSLWVGAVLAAFG